MAAWRCTEYVNKELSKDLVSSLAKLELPVPNVFKSRKLLCPKDDCVGKNTMAHYQTDRDDALRISRNLHENETKGPGYFSLGLRLLVLHFYLNK